MLPGETIASGASPTCPECGVSVRMGIYHSPAGYYIGTYCNCGPYSRETGYYPTREKAQEVFDNLQPKDLRT